MATPWDLQPQRKLRRLGAADVAGGHVFHAHAHVLVGNGVEQAALHLRVDRGRVLHAGRLQLAVGVQRQRLARRAGPGHPAVEVGARHGGGLEVHAREAVSAVGGRHAVVRARVVGDEVQLRLHAGHGIHLAAQLGNEEGVHQRMRGEFESDRRVDGHGQLVDGGHAQVRVDEQPLPVQRHHLHAQRRVLGRERLVGVERVRGAPDQHREKGDDHARNAPHHRLDARGVRPPGRVHDAAVGVGLAVAPGEPQRERDDRNDDGQHDRQREHDQRLFLRADVALRVEQRHAAAGEQREQAEAAPARSAAGRVAGLALQEKTRGLMASLGEVSLGWRHTRQSDVWIYLVFMYAIDSMLL
jgi:hypothetical protein